MNTQFLIYPYLQRRMNKETPQKMTHDEVQREVLAEIQAAEDNRGVQTTKREALWDRYYGRALGNEKKGRSQFITRDVMDTVEWMMPYFIKIFASGDPKIEIEIKGQETFVGKALMEKIQTDLADGTPSIFSLFYQWFKDALVSNTAFVKVGWILDQKTVTGNFEGLTPQNLNRLMNDPDVEIVKIEEITGPFTGPSWTVTAKVKQTIKDTIYVDGVPNWEFVVSTKARDINDEYPKGHETEVTLDYLKRIDRAWSDGEESYFRGLAALETGEGKSEQIDTLSGEKANYMDDDQPDETYAESEVGAKSPVKFREWYTRLDVDGDGYLENIVAYLGNKNLLRHEINQEDFIPFCSIRPIIDCYKFHGISFAELLIEIQNLKTMLFRRILDSFDFQVSGRWRVDPDGSVDLHALYNHTPGGAVTAKQGSLEDISPQPFNPGNFSVLEYVDKLKENRTGQIRYTSDMKEKTATGIAQVHTATMQRLELVARIFAEGLRDFYKKIVLLYQRYLRKPFTAKVHGQEQEITPEMIQGQVVTTVNMGIEASLGIEEAQKIERMIGLLFKVNEMFPGLLNPEKIHNLCRRYITSLGFKQADNFIADLQSYIQQAQQTQEQQQQMQQMMMEMQQKMAEMELAIKGKEADTKAQKVAVDAQLKDKELAQEAMIEGQKLVQDTTIEREKIAQDERDSIRDFKIDMLNFLNGPAQQGAQAP